VTFLSITTVGKLSHKKLLSDFSQISNKSNPHDVIVTKDTSEAYQHEVIADSNGDVACNQPPMARRNLGNVGDSESDSRKADTLSIGESGEFVRGTTWTFEDSLLQRCVIGHHLLHHRSWNCAQVRIVHSPRD